MARAKAKARGREEGKSEAVDRQSVEIEFKHGHDWIVVTALSHDG